MVSYLFSAGVGDGALFELGEELAEIGSAFEPIEPVVLEDLVEGWERLELVGLFHKTHGLFILAEKGIEASEMVIGLDVA